MLFAITLLLEVTSTLAGVLEPMNYYQYTQYQAPISWEDITGKGLKQALGSCQQSFQWQRWNCPIH